MDKFKDDIVWAKQWLELTKDRLVGRMASPVPVEDAAVFHHFVSRSLPPYLEIGVLWGGSMVCAAHSIDGRLYGIDPFWGYDRPGTIDPHVAKGNRGAGELPTIEIAKDNFKEFGIENRVSLYRGLHPPLPTEWEDIYFGVVFIDGNHFTEATLADWNAAKYYANTVIFHDLHQRGPKAAWEMVKEDPMVDKILHEGGAGKFSRMGVVSCIS